MAGLLGGQAARAGEHEVHAIDVGQHIGDQQDGDPSASGQVEQDGGVGAQAGVGQ
ncbi:MAG: hypothetical protein ACT4NY_11055 [Pseudonocardiales bacterium]